MQMHIDKNSWLVEDLRKTTLLLFRKSNDCEKMSAYNA